MHGRKRVDAPPSADVAAALAKKVAAYRQLGGLALRQRLERSREPAAFELCGQLLRVNPDVVSLWNYRRECVLAQLADADEPATAAAVAAELKLSADAIGKNPKSYPAWHHRQWTVERYLAHVAPAHELALCAQLLDADERNFHCWNYRRWLASVAGVPPAAELAYTTQRIHANFSNYSAWHYRTVLLPQLAAAAAAAAPLPAAAAAAAAPPTGLPPDTGEGSSAPAPALLPLRVLADELELLRAAVFTEPDDQSPWLYRRWVLAQLQRHLQLPRTRALRRRHGDGGGGDGSGDGGGDGGGGSSPGEDEAAAAAAAALLEGDVALLRELAAAEPRSKWPLVGIAQALQVLASVAAARGEVAASDTAQAVSEARHGDELRSLYARLAEMDPSHAGYYRYCGLSAAAESGRAIDSSQQR